MKPLYLPLLKIQLSCWCARKGVWWAKARKGLGTEAGSPWLESSLSSMAGEAIYELCLSQAWQPATSAVSFHRRPVRQVLELHTEPLSAGHSVFQLEVCVGHACGGRGSRGLQPPACRALLRKGRALAPKREEVRREERELGPKGTQVETWERDSLGGIQDSGLGTPQE